MYDIGIRNYRTGREQVQGIGIPRRGDWGARPITATPTRPMAKIIFVEEGKGPEVPHISTTVITHQAVGLGGLEYREA